MECYLCHKTIELYEYTRHIGSHPPQDFVAASIRGTNTILHQAQGVPDGQVHSDDRDDSFAKFEHANNHRREAPRKLNAFQRWLQEPTYDLPEYTTIDGQKDTPDPQTAKLTQAAEVMRNTTRQEVTKIVKSFERLPENDKKTCLELVQKVPIFPGLVAYTYTHLIMCRPRGWFSSEDWSHRVSSLKQSVDWWTKDGDVQCVRSYNIIKKELLWLLSMTEVKEHKCNPMLLNGTILLKYDIQNLASVVAPCIIEPEKNGILSQRGDESETLVELFQELLGASIGLEECYRRCFFNALIPLSKETGHCPRSIYLAEDAIDLDLVSQAEGGFGCVYKGRVGSRLVAVKVIKRIDRMRLSDYKKELSKEAIVWANLRHPNCLPFYGVYSMPAGGSVAGFALVSPWMSQGTLSKYLQLNPNANRTKLILDVVRGLNYLHSMEPHVAHRDIKPDNILITEKGRACLADFGLVSAFDTRDRIQTATDQIVVAGTNNYMAPEIFNARDEEARRRVNRRACDMYALGCTIYAAYTGKHPFQGMDPVRVRTNVMSNRRPEFPEGKISHDMWTFVEYLWDQYPSRRLTAAKALRWMEEKARQEGVDSSPAPFEGEWQWRWAPSNDDKRLWSVAL